jgi:hypothetical protein
VRVSHNTRHPDRHEAHTVGSQSLRRPAVPTSPQLRFSAADGHGPRINLCLGIRARLGEAVADKCHDSSSSRVLAVGDAQGGAGRIPRSHAITALEETALVAGARALRALNGEDISRRLQCPEMGRGASGVLTRGCVARARSQGGALAAVVVAAARDAAGVEVTGAVALGPNYWQMGSPHQLWRDSKARSSDSFCFWRQMAAIGFMLGRMTSWFTWGIFTAEGCRQLPPSTAGSACLRRASYRLARSIRSLRARWNGTGAAKPSTSHPRGLGAQPRSSESMHARQWR